MDTLSQFQANMRKVTVKEPSSKLSNELLKLMCSSAADGIKLQCGREYGFSPESDETRATDLTTLNRDKLLLIPTNNLLSIFDNRA